jgi:ComF family protein
MHPWVSRAVASALDWLAPRDCLGCSCELRTDAEWCPNCREQLEPNLVTQIDGLRLIAPLRFAGPLRRAIHRLKYQARSDYARRLVRSVFTVSGNELSSRVLLVPVPLHPLRLVERGYNQSALIARALARRWHVAVAFDMLGRQTLTRPQVGLGRELRVQNARGAFWARPAPTVGYAVWLVDDVVTSGATVCSCRAALAGIGVDVCGAIALAHADNIAPAQDSVPSLCSPVSQALGAAGMDEEGPSRYCVADGEGSVSRWR